ncbi:MAG TPA: DUF6036 family nucleotidyltransferase [Usitatibacter sp.]|nr:DUF6036 family nucleotidyltransferase [Usitatibacter sp.]
MKPHAPALRADPEYFKAFAEIMRRIEHALGKPAAVKGPVTICIAGGAALHLYTGSRVSKDIDAKVMARFLPPGNLEVAWRDADGHARLLYFDTQYNDTFGLLHESAYDDAIRIDVPGVDSRRLDVRLLSPLDLAVSKLSRYEGHDQEDIAALARAGLIDARSLRTRAEEALPSYVGDTRRVKTSIDLAEKLVRRSAPR